MDTLAVKRGFIRFVGPIDTGEGAIQLDLEASSLDRIIYCSLEGMLQRTLPQQLRFSGVYDFNLLLWWDPDGGDVYPWDWDSMELVIRVPCGGLTETIRQYVNSYLISLEREGPSDMSLSEYVGKILGACVPVRNEVIHERI